ncbi:GNAT family N-acetyltransferase [Undibacterium sp. TS12]|uniref:GNAT family N-acetyltransferase n=1 Tax=Undibacterium sp. TS12 TaxID=2908202 RepID=UPI001F4C6608|nr:GNAT family N-acetyltransferase [Undibacterium sp. TS12]MCH8620760.1 GNAT family N-acetyltransferase [Undibacterium sp. TS12]
MISINDVLPAEISSLLAMLLALGESDGVKEILTDENSLTDALFSTTPAAYAKFVCVDDEPAGFVIYSWKWGTFTGKRDMYMQAIYIKPEYRRQRLGEAVMKHLSHIAVTHQCTRIEWLTVKDKDMSKRFYDAIGATEASHMQVRRLQGQALTNLSLTAG